LGIVSIIKNYFSFLEYFNPLIAAYSIIALQLHLPSSGGAKLEKPCAAAHGFFFVFQ
jgi:hypothetical protein